MKRKSRAEIIGESLGSALIWGVIAILVLHFMGYDIVKTEDYSSKEYVEELNRKITYLQEESDYYKYTGQYNAAVATYMEDIIYTLDEDYLENDHLIDDIRMRATDCARAESYYEDDYTVTYDYFDVFQFVDTDILWAVHRNQN